MKLSIAILLMIVSVGAAGLCLGYVAARYWEPAFIVGHPFKVIAGKTFTNEEVLLDGNEYRDCVFRDVTLVYNGTTNLRMVGNRFYGRTNVTHYKNREALIAEDELLELFAIKEQP